MKIYSGVDIIEVQRIQNSIEEHGGKFLNRVFTHNEIEYCEGRGMQKYQSYSARFAAKEAVFKAISDALKNAGLSIEWKDIEILNDSDTFRPFVNLKSLINEKITIDISLSHIKEYAIANCIVYFNEN